MFVALVPQPSYAKCKNTALTSSPLGLTVSPTLLSIGLRSLRVDSKPLVQLCVIASGIVSLSLCICIKKTLYNTLTYLHTYLHIDARIQHSANRTVLASENVNDRRPTY